MKSRSTRCGKKRARLLIIFLPRWSVFWEFQYKSYIQLHELKVIKLRHIAHLPVSLHELRP